MPEIFLCEKCFALTEIYAGTSMFPKRIESSILLERSGRNLKWSILN